MKPEEGKLYLIDFKDEEDPFYGIATCTGAMLYTDEVLHGFNQLRTGKEELHKYSPDPIAEFEEAMMDVWFSEKCIVKEINADVILEMINELKARL